MSTSSLTNILSQLRNNSLSNPQEVSSLLTKAKRQLLNLNALLPSPSTPPQLLSLARQTLETGALLSIRLHEPDAFTRYYQQLLPFYELHESSFEGNNSGQRSKVTGLYLLLLLTKGDYAGFHTVLEGLEVENEGKGGLQGNDYIQYPIKLERWLMEGSYDRVWRATKREGVPSEEFGVFSEVLVGTIRSEIASCSEKAYPSLPMASAKNLLFLDSEGSVVEFAQGRGWVVKDGRVYFPLQQEDQIASEKDILAASGQIIENTIGYARELEMIVPEIGMGQVGENSLVDGGEDYISDDSSFYGPSSSFSGDTYTYLLFAPGDDLLHTSLTKRARSFDPSTYWSSHSLRLSTTAMIASTKPTNPPPATPTSLHNPYANLLSGRQLSETVSAFLARLPPSVTTSASIGSPWIFIANPHAPNRATSEDWADFTARGTELLEALSAARADIEEAMTGKAKATITRKVTPLRKQLEKDLLAAAEERECTTGKWMLFPTVEDVDYVWEKVAKGTAEREFGIAAKVAAVENGGEGDSGVRKLICVYTKNFADAEDVKRVLLRMKELGLLRGDDGGEGRGIYYKCDAFMHLGINSGNEWGIKASLFSSKDVLSGITKE